MAVDITGAEGSLFWKAGIDLSDFDQAINQITNQIQASTQKQILLQQQAAQGQKQIVQSILSSAGLIKGMDQDVEAQVQHLSALQQHIQAIKGQSLELSAKGVDTTTLTEGLDRVLSEIDKIKNSPIELQAGSVDVSPLLEALKSVQAEFDRLSGEELHIKVGSIDTQSVLKSFDDLKTRLANVQDATFELRLSGVNTDKLQTSLDKIKNEVSGLENVSIRSSADLDIEAFQKGYQTILDEVGKLESQSIELKAQGIDTSVLDREIAALKQRAKDASTGFQIKVDGIDDSSFNAVFVSLKKKVESLQRAAITLKIGEIDTASLTTSLQKAQEKLDRLNDFHIEGTITFNDEAFQKTYNELLAEIQNLENQTIELKAKGLDTSEVEAEIQRLRTSLELPPVDIPIKIGSLNEKLAELDQLKKKFAELSEVDRNSEIGQGIVQNIQRVEGEVERINQVFQRVEQNAAGSLNEKVARLNELKNQYAALSEVDRQSDVGKRMAQNIHGLDAEIKKINSQFEQTNSLAKQVAASLAAYATLTTATNFVKDLVRVRGEFQQLNVAFTTMLGSKERADKLMQEVTQFAATTPFELSEVAGATRSLLAFGISADKIKETLRSLGDVSAGVGAPIQEIAEVYGKARVQGRLFAEDINQLTGRGIPIIQELAKQFGVAEDQVRGLVESGKVGFPQIEKAFQDLTAEGSKFGGLMEAQSKTLTGQLSNLSDAWNQMLNNIGKSGEGLFSSAIEGATSLVNHYQDVLDILEVLVVAYGTYKAAVLATVAVQKLQEAAMVQTALAGTELSVAQGLAAAASVSFQRAMQVLNATLLANPFAVAAAGVGLLIGALTFLRDKQFDVKTSTELLKDAQEKSTETFAKQQSEIKQYVTALHDQNLAESTRLEAYNQLKKIAPDIIGQLSFQEAKTTDLTNATNTYIATLRQRMVLESKQAAYAEALRQRDEKFKAAQPFIGSDGKANDGGLLNILNPFTQSTFRSSEGEQAIEAFKKASEVVVGIENDIQNSIGGTKEALQFQISALESQNKVLDQNSKAYNENQKQIDSLKKSLTDLNKTPGPSLTNQQQIDGAASLDALKLLRQKIEDAYNSETDAARKKQLAADLEYADKRKKILDPYAAFKEGQKQQKKDEAETNKLLEKRKDLLQAISDVQRDASQSGLVKEQSEVDKVNEKYDTLLRKIVEFNQEVDKTGNGQKIGLTDINALAAARAQELQNVNLKQDAEHFKQNLEQQKQLFEQYEEAKKQIGVEKANEMFSEQRKGFTSYADFLRNEFGKMLPKIQLGIGNVGEQEKFKTLLKAGADFQKDQIKQQLEDQKTLFEKTASFVQQKEVLDLQYQRLYKTLKEEREKLGEEEYDRQLKLLQQSQKQEVETLRVTSSDIFKRIGRDLLLQTSSDIKKTIDLIDKALEEGSFKDQAGNVIQLTPEMRAQLQNARTQLKGMVDDAGKVANIFKSLGSTVGLFNKGLGEALNLLSSMVEASKSIQDNIKAFKEGKSEKGFTGLLDQISSVVGIAGAVGSVVGSVASFVSSVMGPSVKQVNEQALNFQNQVFVGEQQINQLYRERLRDQVLLNKTKLQGLSDEMELLKKQKVEIQSNIDTVFQQLAKEKAKITRTVDTAVGGTVTFVMQGESLAGKTFDQLNELFLKGQLSDRAKELFQQLEKLKQEGIDVDKALQDAESTRRELLTGGATADSIADSIAEGFAQGKRSAADFADTFKDLMQKAALAALKLRFLDEPLKKFIEQFQDDVVSGDQLDASEVASLKDFWDKMITNASNAMDQIQKIAGIDFSSVTGSSGANSLQGAIKGITEDTAELLAGQFGAMRLTAIEQLNVAMQSLDRLNQIQNNTFNTVNRIEKLEATMVDYFQTKGVKIA
jgi:tape measure domain-containing protein